MTDKEIEYFLKKISDSNNGMGYPFTVNINLSESIENKALKFKEILHIEFLEKQLGLIIVLFEESDGKVAILSIKGREVIENGGWIKYSKNKKKVERNKKTREIVSFWFNIIVTIGSIIIAYSALQIENTSIKNEIIEDVIREYNNINQTTIQEEVKSYMENLNSKKKDSVLLNKVK